jgi:C_GCAxxG_C_C family probable redox protein
MTMPVDAFRLFQLASQGFCCSQILLMTGLEAMGKENPDLVRAMHGLCGGLGRSGGTCGALTGGICLIGLYAGKGTAEEEPDPDINVMIWELLDWFDGTYKTRDCLGILHYKLEPDSDYPVQCGGFISDTYNKVMEILDAHRNPAETENT